MRPCFTFKAKAADQPAVVAIDDEIGFWGTQAKDFRASLDAVEGNTLRVEINSPGGDVFAGLGMYNMLRAWASEEGRTLVTRVTGLAASMASVLALAGDRREMPANTFAMVHSPSSLVWGTADEMREHADTLDKIKASMKAIYMERMGVDEAKVTEILAKDTWFSAEEAKELGFATDVTDAVVATAKFDLVRADLPAHVQAVFKAEKQDPKPEPTPEPEPKPEPEVVPNTPVAEQIATEAKTAGFEALAPFFAINFDNLDAAKARMQEAREITALHNLVGKSGDSAAAIRAGKTTAEVRAALVEAMAADDEENHTSTARKDEKGKGAAVSSSLNPTQIWNSHNAKAKKDAK